MRVFGGLEVGVVEVRFVVDFVGLWCRSGGVLVGYLPRTKSMFSVIHIGTANAKTSLLYRQSTAMPVQQQRPVLLDQRHTALLHESINPFTRKSFSSTLHRIFYDR